MRWPLKLLNCSISMFHTILNQHLKFYGTLSWDRSNEKYYFSILLSLLSIMIFMCPVSKHLCRQGAFTLFNTWMDERGVTWNARRVMKFKWTMHPTIVSNELYTQLCVYPCSEADRAKTCEALDPHHTPLRKLARTAARRTHVAVMLLPILPTTRTLKWLPRWSTTCFEALTISHLFLNNVEKDLMKTLKDWKTVRTFQMQRMEPETPRPDRTNLRCGNHGVDSRVYFVIGLQQNGIKPQNLACFAVWVLHEITME